MKVRLFIVDDHFMVVEGIRSLLQGEPEVIWAGSAGNGAFCLSGIVETRPDVVLMDINLPDCSGFDLCREVRQKFPGIRVIGLSNYNQTSFIRNMLKAGASGYILKNASKKDLLKALRVVTLGGTFLDPEVSRQLNKKKAAPSWVLTKREREVLQLIAEGLTNPEIAGRLYLSTGTVDSHRKHLLLKMGARNSAEMVKLAFQHKVLE